jgi:hypothetical protein
MEFDCFTQILQLQLLIFHMWYDKIDGTSRIRFKAPYSLHHKNKECPPSKVEPPKPINWLITHKNTFFASY